MYQLSVALLVLQQLATFSLQNPIKGVELTALKREVSL